MNYSKSLVGALAAIAAGACLFGQTASVNNDSAGLLGQRYVGVGFFVDDLREVPVDSGLGGSVGVNLPITSNLDLAFQYAYERISDSLLKARNHTVGATLRAYNPYEGVKLFSDATLSHSWSRVRAPGVGRVTENDPYWELGVGVEAPLTSSTALLGRVSYSDAFDGDVDGTWNFTAGVSHRFTAKVDGLASVTFHEDDAVVYAIGVAYRF